MAFIYVITNDVNGKQYVGQTVRSIEERFKEHLDDSRRLDYPLYRAMNKYGIEHFSTKQLEECSIEELNDREIFWIKKLNTYYNGYNATLGGGGFRIRADEYFEISKTYEKTQSIIKTAKKHKCSHSTVRTACQVYGVQIQQCLNQSEEVIGFDKNSLKIIGIFSSMHEAAKCFCENGKVNNVLRDIRRSCKCERPSAYGVIWRQKKDLPEDFEQKNPKEYLGLQDYKPLEGHSHTSTPVTMLDSNNKEIQIFNSCTEAASYLKDSHPEIKGQIKTVANRIGECCRGIRYTAYGYKWEHHNED